MNFYLLTLLGFSAVVHDASTGFHDIKPLPGFSPISIGLILGLSLLALLIVSLACYRIVKNRRPTLENISPVDPYQIAKQKIAALRKEQQRSDLEMRQLMTRLSLILREYLEYCFKFPATDRTPREIIAALESQLRNTLPGLPANLYSEMQLQISEVLVSCEKMTFGHNSDEIFSVNHPRVLELIDQTTATLNTINGHIVREETRTTGVVPDERYHKVSSNSSKEVNQ